MSAEELRVGDAERDEVTTALHEHFAQGRLTREELDERLTAALSARTVGDLREITRDLPGALAATDAARRPAGPWGRGTWDMATAHWCRGMPAAPRAWGPARGGWGPAWSGWGPPRGRPFGPLLLVALIVAAVTGGWWVVVPALACLWLAVAVRGIRHARRRLAVRR
jgi:hypothetical protein